ncbi:MAG TPA: ORF6N domain-containing protein [Candidatus Limnocylindria bacterium]|nr:ORF6N domain-containing protein [Candidatus Limnocylindria bacterium]
MILELRGVRVLLDRDLADLYGVTTKALNQAVTRNPLRFPVDFAFRLTPEEAAVLKSQIVTSNAGRGGPHRALPRAFTEQGVGMLASVLRNRRAAAVNVEIIRAFVRLCRLHMENAELTRRLDALEARYDRSFGAVFEALRVLMAPPKPTGREIGFRPPPKTE